MMATRSGSTRTLILLTALLYLAGCNGEADSQTAEQANHAPAKSPAVPATTADDSLLSISLGDEPEGMTESAAPPKGSPEWILLEIHNLRQEPISTDMTAAQIEKVRLDRHRSITDMALEAIMLTHEDPAKEPLFNAAVHQLMESRLELALSDPTEVDALYEDRDMLYKRKPKSPAAAEAAFVVARFAHTRARDFAKQEPRWLDEFSRQARTYASSFPGNEARAVSLLYAAGWSCELHGHIDEAIACYTQLRESFPNSPQGQQIPAVLRRLELKGKPVELAGATLDGKYLSIDKYAGKVVLVVFWASENQKFQLLLPKILEAEKRYSKHGLAVIGVNLDDDQEAVEAFISEKQIRWPQVFDSDPAKRRWKNEVVKYYGVRNIPLLWLIDQQGIVVDPQLAPEQLDEQVRALLSKRNVREE